MPTVNTHLANSAIMYATMAALGLKRERASKAATSQVRGTSTTGSSSLQMYDSRQEQKGLASGKR